MLKLCWRSVCLVTGSITIEGMTTKTLQTRRVAITERMRKELTVLWETSSQELDTLVFGQMVNMRRERALAAACQAAGIEYGSPHGITFHSLRHTAATHSRAFSAANNVQVLVRRRRNSRTSGGNS